MDILGYLSAWRRRWVSVVAALAVGIGCAAVLSAFTQPQFVATAQLFVTTTGGASVVEAYQGNLFGEERVVSYAKLASGEQVAQRAVDQLQIDMTAQELMSHVEAEPIADTVLFDISVSDPDPELATDLANAVALQTTQLVEELETSVRGGSPAATAAFVNEAEIPTTAAVPNWARNLAVGGLAGLFVGLVAAVVRDKLDDSVRAPQQAAAVAEADLLGAVPGGRGGADDGIPFDSAEPATAEAFRVMRTNVLAVDGESDTGALVVAAPTAGMGATTVSLGLAAAAAESGRSVVLVDADLQGRSASTRLKLDDSPGLKDVLEGTAQPGELVVATDVKGLFALPAGPGADSPSELLAGEALGKVVKVLANEYDLVLIDVRPALPYSDAVVLASHADGVLLVSRRNMTTGKQIAAAADKIRAAKSRVVGVIVTDAGKPDAG